MWLLSCTAIVSSCLVQFSRYDPRARLLKAAQLLSALARRLLRLLPCLFNIASYLPAVDS